MSISTLPDCYKALGKGISRAMAIQKHLVYINLVGCYGVNLLFIWLFAFHMKLETKGLLFAKLINEFFLMISYLVFIRRKDWRDVIIEAYERRLGDESKLMGAN